MKDSNFLTKGALDYCPKYYGDISSKLGYNQRILDAFADLFWFHTDCSAAVLNSSATQCFLSLNSSAGKEPNKKFFNLKSSPFLNPVIQILSSEKINPNDLLAIRLCSNKHFRDKVIKQVAKNYIPYQNFTQLSSDFSAFCKTYEICKSKKNIKNWKEIAGFYNLLNEKNIFLEHINDEDVFNVILNCVSSKLLNIYLAGIKDLLEQNLNLELDTLQSLIRPLQDSYKITYWLQSHKIDNFIPIDVEDIKKEVLLLYNGEPIHAENALYYYSQGKANYYGTSKLSCYFCHEKLGKEALNHRGSHYQFDKWGTLDKIDVEIKEKIKTLGVESLPQKRKLSFDDFEKDIIVTLSGDTNISKTSIEYINPYFGKYTLDAIYSILQLRLFDIDQFSNINILQGSFFDKDKNNITDVIKGIISSDKDTILVPLNLFNKHAVGLIFERNEDNSYQIKYIDPINNPIPGDLLAGIQNVLSDSQYEQIKVEQQKYANCGPEVIENFILYLTGTRVSQEKAIELHSKLVENHLLNANQPSLHLLFEEFVTSDIANLEYTVGEYLPSTDLHVEYLGGASMVEEMLA